MHVSVVNSRGEHEWVAYDPYEEDAQRRESQLAEWMKTAIARFRAPWFMPRLNRIENAINEVNHKGGRT